MTIDEFQVTAWSSKMTAQYRDNKTYKIGAVDFDEMLIGLIGVTENDPDGIVFVRCENCTLMPRSAHRQHVSGGDHFRRN